MHAWQFMKALGIQRANGWAQFVSMQNYYNLMYREDEREMLPLCLSEGIATTPWSPLARGKLARPWSEEPPTARAKTDQFARVVFAKTPRRWTRRSSTGRTRLPAIAGCPRRRSRWPGC
jgi:aryl-alcohol dehydrogenase-like predicted oxidoreductase